MKGFRDFILRGNVVDLAVGIIIGAAFSAIVTALVKDLITPLIGIFGNFNFPDWTVSFPGSASKFAIGDFINSVISFLIIAAVVYFFVVLPINEFMKHVLKEKAPDPTTRACPFCYNMIPKKATRCGFCTSEVETLEEVAAVIAAEQARK
ncbi:MAG TPA: large conductance mechanosensitive channel protein MscL [Ktedonobacterales bacterium]|jgi:large conductance mechanosensitive channel